jgi:hypothetical protein
MIKQTIIDGEKWQVHLSEDKQLSFSYLVPHEKSQWKTNPLWHDWDYESNEEEWSYSMKDISKVNPMRLKSLLFKLIVNAIKESKTTFFYFKPTSKQRGTIYSNLVNKLLQELGSKWVGQIIDNNWFYFNKIENQYLN